MRSTQRVHSGAIGVSNQEAKRESPFESINRSIAAVRLYQQFESAARGEDHGGRSAQFRHDGRLSGRHETALPLINPTAA
jgi:hypothetical protein